MKEICTDRLDSS